MRSVTARMRGPCTISKLWRITHDWIWLSSPCEVRRLHPLPSGGVQWATQASREERAREAAIKRLEGENPSDVRKDLARNAVAVDPQYFIRDEDYAAADAALAAESHPSAARPFDWQSLAEPPRAPSTPDVMVPMRSLGNLLNEQPLQVVPLAQQATANYGRFGPGFRANTEMLPIPTMTPREEWQRTLITLAGGDPSPYWRQTINEIMGTEGGLFGTGMGAVDFTHVGSGLDALEAIEKKRWQDILPLLLLPPVIRKGASASGHLAREAVEYLEGLFGREARQAEKNILPMVDETGGAGGIAGKRFDEAFPHLPPPPKGVIFKGVGPHGPILDGSQGQWLEMLDWMKRAKTGDLRGVLYHPHPDIGPIDIIWGNEKGGLQHIILEHGDEGILEDLPARLAQMKVLRTASYPDGTLAKIVLSSGIGGRGGTGAVISLNYDFKAKNWLLTAYKEWPPL